MTVIILENAKASVRGQLTRWMLEVKTGVFVGRLSVKVQKRLWEMVQARNARGGCVLIARARNEQGFTVETHGDTSRTICDIEGLLLVSKPIE